MARIISIVRARNEEIHIARHCEHHDFADLILLADGGSEDDTVQIAKQYPNVKISPFLEVMKLDSGYVRNPDWKHINFLIEWAEEEGADWIVMDDCDTNPNYLLRDEARQIIEEAEHPYIKAVQIHLWGKDHYFPQLACPNGEWHGGIWAWKAEMKLRTYGEPPHFMFKSLLNGPGDVMVDFDKVPAIDLQPPYCRIHTVWEDKERAAAHVTMYRNSGLIKGMTDISAFAGNPAGLEPWMKYGE